MSEPGVSTPLVPDDFAEFYEIVHGVAPFPWQRDLVSRVLTDGRWPDLVDVPTGLGKTSTLDIAVFVSAATAAQEGAARSGRRRIFFVVDRRIVVDEAFEHARTLSTALERAEPDSGAVHRVAAALHTLAPDVPGELLPVTRMRGGTTWASAWLDRPDRPGIVLGTVDQIGSRLLFRGYGVTDRRRPLDAALTGTDSLILVDEAHLAVALSTTISAAQERDRLALPLPSPALVRLTATGEPTRHTYTIDVDAHRDDATAWKRLTAAKRLTLSETTPRTCVRDLADIVVEQLHDLTGPDAGAPVALVVCNTIDRAREVHARLRGALPDADCELLIGRARPLDRPDLQQRVLKRFGTDRLPAERVGVLVATQTVEVGVNLDVDVLVSESASWEAVVQRLGRLNRTGRFTERFPDQAAAPAVLVHDGVADGPVYGAARDATWAALRSLGDTAASAGVAVSPLDCRELTAATFGADCTRRPADVPVLLTPTLDAWTRTAPVPLNDPPVAPFLHGFDGSSAAVQVLWRDGLMAADPLDDLFGDGVELAAPQLDALLTQWPPRTPELVEIPFLAARRWIGGTPAGPVGDVDIDDDEAPRTSGPAEPFRVLVQRRSSAVRDDGRSDAPTSWTWIDESQLRPGDTVVVPTERGGLDEYGWAPARRDSQVRDVSEAATFASPRVRTLALRLDSGLASRLGLGSDEADLVDQAVAAVDDAVAIDGIEPSTAEAARAVARSLAAGLPAEPPPLGGWTSGTWEELRRWLTDGLLRIVEIHDPSGASVDGDFRAWARLLTGPRPGSSGDAEGDDEETGSSSVASGPVTLATHHGAVRRRATEIAAALRLPPELRSVIADAAGWHDLGKVEERFQVMLHDGDPTDAALAPEPLAKSGMDPADRMSWRRALRLSGLPSGARHEAWSAALVEEHLAGMDTPYPGDTDLLVHLVASHHGYSRPLARLVTDPSPRPVQAVVADQKVTVPSDRTVSLEHPARFALLNARYGRWGLALLESVVRCADTTVSGEGS